MKYIYIYICGNPFISVWRFAKKKIISITVLLYKVVYCHVYYAEYYYLFGVFSMYKNQSAVPLNGGEVLYLGPVENNL